MKRQHTYKLIAILLPFILVVVVEIILRIVNYGYDTHLFVTDQDARFWVMNRDISKKYFTAGQNATIGNQETFYKKKPAGTLRFFVLGASSSIGFPYMHNGSFARMLKYKLQFRFPQNNIEIINLSLTAVNTYTLYDFSAQLVDYEPDGVLIYAGHNEYYGALGVASSSRIGRNPLLIRVMLAARNLKLIQAFSQLAGSFKPKDTSVTDQDLTLMERMAARQQIPYQSEAWQDGIKQFDRNLGDMLHLFEQHHIPVFIGTLACNLKGQKPLSKDSVSVRNNAIQEYNLAEKACADSSWHEAQQHYMLAKEYDGLRFRAPEAFNDIIRKYGKRMQNVYVADIAARFAANSPNGIVGNELMLEHVLPNLVGQRLIADSFYDALLADFPAFKTSAQVGTTVDLATEYPVTSFDTIYGDLVIWKLRQQWPFNEPASELNYDKNNREYRTAAQFFVRKLNWGQAMQQLNNHYIQNKDYAGALRIVEQMCLELPHEKVFLKQAASLALRLQQQEKASYYLKQAGYGG